MEGLFCPTPVIPFGCMTSTILKGEAIATPGISLLITSFKPLHGFSVLDTKQEDNARLPADFYHQHLANSQSQAPKALYRNSWYLVTQYLLYLEQPPFNNETVITSRYELQAKCENNNFMFLQKKNGVPFYSGICMLKNSQSAS